MTAPHWPAPVGARVHVEGHGEGSYVGFDFNLLSRVTHTIDFDGGGEAILRSDFPYRDSWCLRRLCCCSATRPVVSAGWWVVADPGSVQVSTLMAPEPQTIPLSGGMSMCELRSEIARRFEVPPEQQRLVLQGEGQTQGDPGTEGSGGGDGGLVGEGSDPSATVWGSGVRAGMRLLLVAADSPAAVDERTWSVERVVRLRRGSTSHRATRLKQRVKAVGVVGVVGAMVGAVVGVVVGGGFVGGGFDVVNCVYGVVGGGVGGSIAEGCLRGFVMGSLDFNLGAEVTAGNFTAALEGRDYVPLRRTRGWGTTVSRQLGTPVNS
jgi:hypothetical protein